MVDLDTRLNQALLNEKGSVGPYDIPEYSRATWINLCLHSTSKWSRSPLLKGHISLSRKAATVHTRGDANQISSKHLRRRHNMGMKQRIGPGLASSIPQPFRFHHLDRSS